MSHPTNDTHAVKQKADMDTAASSSSIEARVIAIMVEQLMLPKENITLDSTLSSLNIQSLEFAELLMTIDSEFNVQVLDEDAKNIITVQQLIDYIKLQQK